MTFGDIGYEEVLFALFALALIFMDVYKSKKYRDTIRERAQREYEEAIELTVEELESRLGESELLYEDFEQTHWMTVGLLLGICSYIYWHVWYLSVAISVSVVFIGWKYIAIRPFTTDSVNHSKSSVGARE